MSARNGLGLDTAFLQGVDSHVRRARGEQGPFDPHSEVTFVQGIDAVTDTVPLCLVLPQETHGYLAAVGSHIEQHTTATPGGEHLIPMKDARGAQLYDEFFLLLEKDPAFLQDVAEWTWFQLFDPEALRGYATRLGSESIYENSGMGLQFTTAATLAGARVRTIANTLAIRAAGVAAQQGIDLLQPITELHAAYGLRSHGDLGHSLDSIENDLETLRPLATKLETIPVALLMLAFSGSVFRRGWQYGGVYEKFTTAEAYLPQPLRSAFMRHTTLATDQSATARVRLRFWSWGALLERAMTQLHGTWATPERICRVIDEIRAEHLQTSVTWHPSQALDDVVREQEDHIKELRQLATAVGLLVTTDDVVARWRNVVTWSTCLAPHLGWVTLVHLLHGVLGPTAFGVDVAGLGGLAAAEIKLGHGLHAFGERLSHRLLASVLRISGEDVARKIVGLEWTEADTVSFVANQPTVIPAHMM